MILPVTAARKIRVLHLIHTVAYGGVETAILNWMRAINGKDFEIHVASFANPGATEQPFVEAAQRQGIAVSLLGWNRRKPVLRAARELRDLAIENNIDIVHAHNCYADVVTAVAARLPGKRFRTMTTAYVWFDFKNWKRNLIQWIDAQAMKRLDCVTAHCEHTREETIKRGFERSSVRTLICGFETHRTEFSATERSDRRFALGANDSTFVLISVARFYPEKAHVFLLECFARIIKARPEARLWLAGVGPLEQSIRAACSRLQLDSYVRFLGFVVDLPPLLALADMQIHPAVVEGVPLAICEGMAASLPIVASSVGGLPEILDNGRNGVLVGGQDATTFSDAVLALMNDKTRAAEYGSRARAFIENDYSLSTAVTRVEATYRELAAC